MGGSPSRHHPAAATENRRAGAHHRAPHLDPFQSRLSLAERLRRRLHGPALLKKPASYRTRTSNQNRGPALHVKCAQKSLPVCQGGRSAFQKIRGSALAEKTSRHRTIPQPQFRTREKSGLTISPLECAVTSKHRVLPGFGRSCPPVTPLECAVTQIDAVSPLECALTKKVGGGG